MTSINIDYSFFQNIAVENKNLASKLEESVIEAYIALHQYITFSNCILQKLLDTRVRNRGILSKKTCKSSLRLSTNRLKQPQNCLVYR